ncbi:hypothetical protein CKM354_000072600 [Cercospora kikuchii]|uniref:Uncharacterized protein n=1 Tax=Cercospora kikuchii TaxID=84275 RepID=A0A9P3FBY0_9PEZI|nr:uncharacterized protein CKM354_000072600 [Cercospora kikuchii]GIZ37274.1 hypothetical protein CKM354_000072600 [Cercospora kikuchii]
MAFTDVVKILFVPALIAGALYGIISFIILPLIRNYRERYSQYLPLDTVNRHTEGLRDRISDLVMRMVVPRRQTVWDATGSRRGSRSGSGDDLVFSDGEGERMAGFDAERIDRTIRGGDVSVSR